LEVSKLSAVAALEKNKIATTNAFLILIELLFEGVTIRVVNNTEEIEWPSGSGQVWTGFPFQLGDIAEDSRGELPHLQLKISNVTKTMGRYLEQYKGGTDAKVIVRVVMSDHLELSEPILYETFGVEKTSSDAMWSVLNLGPAFSTKLRVPQNTFHKNFCSFKFKGALCGYYGPETQCGNKTLKRCRELGNSHRFGGEPGIPGENGFRHYV
jgi:phage-related protein